MYLQVKFHLASFPTNTRHAININWYVHVLQGVGSADTVYTSGKLIVYRDGRDAA